MLVEGKLPSQHDKMVGALLSLMYVACAVVLQSHDSTPSPPTAPSDSPTLRLVQPQFTQLTLAWDEPSQPNGQLTQYVIQYRQGSGRWVETTVSASAKYKLFTSGFDSGSRYQVRIAAVNAAGRGPFSTSVQFTMQPPGEWERGGSVDCE